MHDFFLSKIHFAGPAGAFSLAVPVHAQLQRVWEISREEAWLVQGYAQIDLADYSL